MATLRVYPLTMLTMVALASNSLLCRLALEQISIDAASFTTLRLLSGALVLWSIAGLRRSSPVRAGDWVSACALFAFASGFSFAYLSLTAGTGALLLFGAVQAIMVGYGLWCGERLHRWQVLGLVLAVAGLVGLLLPGITAPAPAGALAMLISGGVVSRLFYALWYQALKGLRATSAAAIQLRVPILAAFGGILLLDEQLTLRLVLFSLTIFSGIAMVLVAHQQPLRASE